MRRDEMLILRCKMPMWVIYRLLRSTVIAKNDASYCDDTTSQRLSPFPVPAPGSPSLSRAARNTGGRVRRCPQTPMDAHSTSFQRQCRLFSPV